MDKFNRTILLVEDDGNDQFLIGRAVRRISPGTDLRVVPDVGSAVAYLSGFDDYADRDRHPLPDYIITDLHLPVTNGFHLLDQIKASPVWRQIPVIVLASSTSPRDVAMAYRCGAAAYFIKPNALDDLEALVRQIVGYWSGAAVPTRSGDDNPFMGGNKSLAA
jgi:CheY-like chemotaxis protein